MVQVSKSDPKVFRISVLKATRSFTFRCENEENAKDWIKLIHEQILTSKGHSKVMTKTSIQEKFWKFDRISPQQLAEISDTGDIILFRSYDFIAFKPSGVWTAYICTVVVLSLIAESSH